MNAIYKKTGLNKSNLKHYCMNHCYICGKTTCDNKVFDQVEKCGMYKPIKSIDEWWIELKKFVYENETPYQDGEGGIDENSDATSEMLDMLNTDAEEQIMMIECWAKGDTPKKALDYWLETMRP